MKNKSLYNIQRKQLDIQRDDEYRKLQEEQKFISIRQIESACAQLRQKVNRWLDANIIHHNTIKEETCILPIKEQKIEETICLDKDVILQKMEIELIKYIFNIFNNMTENDNFSKKLLKISDESFIGTLLHSLLNTDLLYDFYGYIQQSDISLEIEHMNPDFKLRLVSHLNDICSKKGIKSTRERYILTDYELLLDYVRCMINLYWEIEQIQRHLVSKL